MIGSIHPLPGATSAFLVNRCEMRFEDYFSFEAIVRDLVKWRIAGKDVDGTLPPRKMWSRVGVKARKGVDPAVVRKQSILRTVKRACGGTLVFAAGTAMPHAAATSAALPVSRGCKLDDHKWGRKLSALVEEVQTAVFSGKVAFEPPKMFKMGGPLNLCKTFRKPLVSPHVRWYNI